MPETVSPPTLSIDTDEASRRADAYAHRALAAGMQYRGTCCFPARNHFRARQPPAICVRGGHDRHGRLHRIHERHTRRRPATVVGHDYDLCAGILDAPQQKPFATRLYIAGQQQSVRSDGYAQDAGGLIACLLVPGRWIQDLETNGSGPPGLACGAAKVRDCSQRLARDHESRREMSHYLGHTPAVVDIAVRYE